MPIRINLLADDQLLEEERRRDPVKRAYLAGGVLLALVLFWSACLQIKAMTVRSELQQLEVEWSGMANAYDVAVARQHQVIAAEQKLAALQNMTTNRFLWGTALNALQKAFDGVEAIQVAHLKCAQTYALSEEVKSTTRDGVEVPGKPAQATERVVMVIDALDASTQPGGNVNKFKQALSKVPYFAQSLQPTNGVLLTSLSAPQVAPSGQQPFVSFSVQCYFPEQVR